MCYPIPICGQMGSIFRRACRHLRKHRYCCAFCHSFSLVAQTNIHKITKKIFLLNYTPYTHFSSLFTSVFIILDQYILINLRRVFIEINRDEVRHTHCMESERRLPCFRRQWQCGRLLAHTGDRYPIAIDQRPK